MSVLIDTNILVYAWDASDKLKQARAIELLDQYRMKACLSVQNLSEFTSVMLRSGSDPSWIREVVSIYSQLMKVLTITSEDVVQAMRGVEQYKMSFWDAQIWSVAINNGISIIFSEDGPTNQTIEEVTFQNPF